MKQILMILIRIMKPWVWRFAAAFDLHVDRPLHAYGHNPLVIAGDPRETVLNIPKSVYFNTRSGRICGGRTHGVGEDVKVLTGKHMNIEEEADAKVGLHYVPPAGRDIVIGSGCYIGSGAIIVGPVEIGDHAVIELAASLPAELRREKYLKYIAICGLYDRVDLMSVALKMFSSALTPNDRSAIARSVRQFERRQYVISRLCGALFRFILKPLGLNVLPFSCSAQS